MNFLRPSPAVRHAIFVAANLMLCTVIAVFVVLPTRDVFAERNAHIAEQRTLLARLTSIAAQEHNVQVVAKQAAEMRDDVLVGPNDGVVNAGLQTRLKTMAETAGARMRSLQTLPPVTNEKIRFNGARIDIVGTLQSIHRAIHEIEGIKPHLFITSAVMKPSPPAGASRPGVAEPPLIQVQLDVFGAVQIGGRNQ